MPVINFAKAKGAYLGTKKGNKAYIGDELVWKEQSNFIITKTKRVASTYSKYILIEFIDKIVDVSRITKVEIGDRWVFDGSIIKSLAYNLFYVSQDVGALTGGVEIPADIPIKIYYE